MIEHSGNWTLFWQDGDGNYQCVALRGDDAMCIALLGVIGTSAWITEDKPGQDITVVATNDPQIAAEEDCQAVARVDTRER